ncbi:MAG: ABC transporter substrate-binding protein [Rhodobacteraceae bacterium]|nr:ABC transporter substrate-binding protein [Paracoccaceae bacterium]MCY4138204.1 ABC transporter substrate-binding protein [Paracoccaceae bacterium]
MTHVRTGFAAGAVAFLAMFFASADAVGQSGSPKRLVVGLDSEPITLNAHANSEAKALQIGHLTTCFLTTLNDINGGPVQPGVATSWEFVSPTEVLFHLRDDVKFHNGRQLTADDIVFTINWTQNVDNGSIHRNKSLLIDRAEKSDEYAVTVHLKSPYPPLIELLAYLPVVAEDTIDTLDTAPVGCGPFKFVRWDRDQQILFETNKEYYGGPIAFDELVLRVFQDYNAEMTAFLAGEVDIFQFLSSVDIPTIEARSDQFYVQSIDDYGYYLSTNTKKEVLANSKVREAIKYALDKETLVNLLVAGSGTPVSQLVVRTNPYYNDSLDWERDVERARQALIDAGHPDGLDLKISSADQVVNRDIGVVLKEQLEEVGFRIDTEVHDSGSFFAGFNEGKYELATGGFGFYADPGLRTTFILGTTTVWKRYGYQNAEYDELYAQGLAETDPEARKAIYTQMGRKAIDEAGFFMLFSSTGNAAVKNSVRGLIYRSSGNSDFTKITFDE